MLLKLQQYLKLKIFLFAIVETEVECDIHHENSQNKKITKNWNNKTLLSTVLWNKD